MCKLAESFGFTKDRQRGSHSIYINLNLPREYSFMNFQEGRDGKAKPRQIKQLLEAIEHLE
ncbi:MAG: type II toxin-antitoxin system HicA family toxin [Acidobacteriota bacterium]|nr:type II toxin-antitoxin system HicA family toxin [Acidobacteriota bacterium]